MPITIDVSIGDTILGGKFKNKSSNSKLCTACLFGISTKEAIKKGLIL